MVQEGAWSGGVAWSQGGGGIPSCTEARPPPVNRMTNRCKNITLLQTSFAGGKYPVMISRRADIININYSLIGRVGDQWSKGWWFEPGLATYTVTCPIIGWCQTRFGFGAPMKNPGSAAGKTLRQVRTIHCYQLSPKRYVHWHINVELPILDGILWLGFKVDWNCKAIEKIIQSIHVDLFNIL